MDVKKSLITALSLISIAVIANPAPVADLSRSSNKTFGAQNSARAGSVEERLAALERVVEARASAQLEMQQQLQTLLQAEQFDEAAARLLLEKQQGKWTQILVNFGSAPMFFYILHLYVLLALHWLLLTLFGANQGDRFGMEHMGWIWLTSVLLAVALYYPTKQFSLYKKRSQQAWIRYL